jgi:hypothetical protein
MLIVAAIYHNPIMRFFYTRLYNFDFKIVTFDKTPILDSSLPNIPKY